MKKTIKGVITYVINGDNVLLIFKKRGHGRGWYNGPGGKVLPGEMPLMAALRETEEEIGIIPESLELCGFIKFYDVYSEDWEVFIFRTHRFKGEPVETEEAKPIWFQKQKIPYDKMWEDDKYWLPHVLEGRYFIAEFKFQKDRLLEKKVNVISKEEFYKKIKNLS